MTPQNVPVTENVGSVLTDDNVVDAPLPLVTVVQAPAPTTSAGQRHFAMIIVILEIILNILLRLLMIADIQFLELG